MRTFILAALLLMLVPSAAFAEMKVGVINFEGIVAQSNYGQSAKKKMEAKVKQIESAMQATQKQLETFQKEMSKQSMALSQEAQKTKIAEYRQKVLEFEQKRRQSQEQLAQAEREIFKPVIELLVKVTQDHARKNGYDLMLNAKNSVIYANDPLDLTMVILDEFNKASAGK